MSPSALLPFVEKFPHVSPEERALLLEWARTTPLLYGASKPFKKLFKTVEAVLNDGEIDIELLGVLLKRVDEAAFTQSSTRWEAVEGGIDGRTLKSVSGNGFTYTVRQRDLWYENSGCRLVISSDDEKTGLISALRKTLGLTAQDNQAEPQKIAFEFDGPGPIHEVKSLSLDASKLRIVFSSLRYFGALRDHEYVFVVDVSDPNFIYLQNEGPKPPTLQYMKRRARRILRHLSQKNPELYLQLALQLLRERDNQYLDDWNEWARMDVLFANSVRWKQTRPGRGHYYKKTGHFVRWRREERAPQIWDAHLDQARELLADANVPLEANEMALKVLRANGGDLSNRVLERAQLLRFLNSNLPLLQVFAARQLTQLLQSGEELSGSLWVFLMLRGNVQTRRLLEKHHSVDERWNNEATETLFGVLEQRQGKQKRRALKLLFERFQERISDDVFWKHLEAFAGVSEPMHAWVLSRIQQTSARGDCARLTQLSTIRGKFGNEAIDAFFAGAANAQPSLEQAFSLVTTGNDDIGWRFLAATALTSETARQLWERVWLDPDWRISRIFGTSEEAYRVFERAGFTSEDAVILQISPNLLVYLSPEFYAIVVRTLSPLMQMQYAFSAEELRWSLLRGLLLQTLQDDETLSQFWAQIYGFDSDKRSQALDRIFSDVELTSLLEKSVRSLRPPADQLITLVTGKTKAGNIAGWQFLKNIDLDKYDAHALWRTVLHSQISGQEQELVWSSATESEAALHLFETAELSFDDLKSWFPSASTFALDLPLNFFIAVFGRVTSMTQIDLTLLASDEQWNGAREVLLQTLQNPESLGAFWNQVFKRVASGADEALQKRLLDDEEIAATFLRVPSETIAELLAHTPMEIEPLLLRWLDANINRLGRSDGALLAAATHPFGAIRERGLARFREVGLDLPLALRLMEAGLPQPFELAKSWFETHEELDVADRALALCDSPDATVRAFGREFLEKNRDRVLDAKLLKKLSENSDPQMQAWLAEHLLKDAPNVKVAAFDQAVLKARGRARRAKEAVKARRDVTKTTAIEYSNDDIASLLDVARGRTKRDKEWALQQLAQVALSGREVEGVALNEPRA